MAAAMFISQEFERAGLKPLAGFNGYYGNALPDGAVNVAGIIPGSEHPNRLLIFSAHFDHIGTMFDDEIVGKSRRFYKKDRRDTVFNGANDNASGVAAMLALAKYFGKGSPPSCSILFVAFNAEERGLHGSRQLSRQLRPDSIIAMINLEMLGRVRGKDVRPFITGADQSNLRSILNKNLFKADPVWGRDYFQHDPAITHNLFERSDNYSFFEKGVVAHTIMVSSDADKYYHTIDDEIETLDFNIISAVCRALVLATHGLISLEDRPVLQ